MPIQLTAHPMKLPPAIATALRHAFTALAGLGAFLAAHGWLDPADAPAVDAAGVALGDGLGVVAAALVARFVWWVGSQIVSGGGGSSVPLFIVLTGCGAAAVGTLPSCSLPAPSGSEYPVSGFVSYTDPQTGAQVGFNVGQPPKPKKAKAPKIIPAK